MSKTPNGGDHRSDAGALPRPQLGKHAHSVLNTSVRAMSAMDVASRTVNSLNALADEHNTAMGRARSSIVGLRAEHRSALSTIDNSMARMAWEQEQRMRALAGPRAAVRGLHSTLRGLDGYGRDVSGLGAFGERARGLDASGREALGGRVRGLDMPDHSLPSMAERAAIRENQRLAEERRRSATLASPRPVSDTRPTWRAENLLPATVTPALRPRRDDVPNETWLEGTRTFHNAFDEHGASLGVLEAKVLTYRVFKDPEDDATTFKLTLQLTDGSLVPATIKLPPSG